MPIDEKIGTEYETDGMTHCRAGRLAHVQQDCCLECLVSLLDFEHAAGGSYGLCYVGLFGYSPFPIPQVPNSPIPHAARSM